MLSEVRRTSLGEFMDDLEMSKHVAEFFGLSTEVKKDPLDDVGRSRLGSEDILNILGLTLILLTALFILVILLVFFCKCCSQRCKLSLKNKNRVE